MNDYAIIHFIENTYHVVMHEVSPSQKPSITELQDKRRLIFGDFVFYPAKLELFYLNAPCILEPKMYQLLTLLIEARPEVLSKETLIQALWPNAVVSDWSLARLVSDTRKLIEDDGQQQSIIKTVRGKGFTFAANVDEIIDAYSGVEKHTSKPKITSKGVKTVKNKTSLSSIKYHLGRNFNIFILALLSIIAGYYIVKQANLFEPNQSKIDHTTQDHYLDVMYQIQKNLRLTRTTYLAQKRRRNQLRSILSTKAPEKTNLSAEELMRFHYPTLTSDEKFIFDQIRAMTEGPTYQGNSAILKLLDLHPEVYREIDAFVPLYNHLSLWQNKYHRVFENQPDMCVVFVGEEDGVPFPSEVDGLVNEWITNYLKTENKNTL